MHGFDKEGHLVYYNVFGAFKDMELHQNYYGDEEKRVKFFRWRIQFLEKSIKNLISVLMAFAQLLRSMVSRILLDMLKRELRQATNQVVAILQDDYLELVAK